MSNQFKQLTSENWKTGDDIFHWPQPIAEDKWVRACLNPQLKPIVPQEIRDLFEVARGSMIYGWFYYPLITLAKEQFARIMETAARERCRQLGIAPARITKKGEKKELPFADVIEALVTHGTISAEDHLKWHLTRKVRNESSHPERQSIINPAMALYSVEGTVDAINKLFP